MFKYSGEFEYEFSLIKDVADLWDKIHDYVWSDDDEEYGDGIK